VLGRISFPSDLVLQLLVFTIAMSQDLVDLEELGPSLGSDLGFRFRVWRWERLVHSSLETVCAPPMTCWNPGQWRL
jgi:hypothetical protein